MKKNELRTPCYIIDEGKLESNLKLLKNVSDNTNAKVLLAQKAFSCFYEYPLIGQYLNGATASGLYEARLGYEEMGKENHVFSPAFREDEIKELVKICDHIIFNSVSQFEKHRDACQGISIGLRINPEYSTQEGHEIYDPCAPGSRLGVTLEMLETAIARGFDMSRVEGFHMHTLCEQNSDDLEATLDSFEERFGKYLPALKWINLGGGHHITRADYDIPRLEKCVRRLIERYNVDVYLEPGEAVALNAGYLETTVLDIVTNGDYRILILDTSAACHMPDVLEMPYRPPLKDSGLPNEKKYTYRLSSCTCLAGDVIGDYSFDREIKIGDRLEFEDMAIYSMVKNNTFNGMALPDIVAMDSNGDCRVIRSFDYSDFKNRLA